MVIFKVKLYVFFPAAKNTVVGFEISIRETFVRAELLETGYLVFRHSELPRRQASAEAKTRNQQQRGIRNKLSADFHDERHFAKVLGFMPASRSFAWQASGRCRFLRV